MPYRFLNLNLRLFQLMELGHLECCLYQERMNQCPLETLDLKKRKQTNHEMRPPKSY